MNKNNKTFLDNIIVQVLDQDYCRDKENKKKVKNNKEKNKTKKKNKIQPSHPSKGDKHVPYSLSR